MRKSDLIMLRPAIGVSPFNYKNFIGRKLKYNRKKGDLLNKKILIDGQIEILILAAGGTRMKNNTPKLLNRINNQTILDKTIKNAQKMKSSRINVVINKDYNSFIKNILKLILFSNKKIRNRSCCYVISKKEKINNNLLIMMGDAPSINYNSIKDVVKK